MKYAYKIVDKKMRSIRATGKSVRIDYKLGKWTQPKIKGSKIFVFRSKRRAERQIERWEGQRLFKCLVEEMKPIYCVLDTFHLSARRIELFWTSRQSTLRLISAYNSAFVTGKVKLIEEIL